MFTLSKLLTYDGWGEWLRQWYLKDMLMFFALMFFMKIGTLGILNLIVGNMCQSAMRAQDREVQHGQILTIFRRYEHLMEIEVRFHGGEGICRKYFSREEVIEMFEREAKDMYR